MYLAQRVHLLYLTLPLKQYIQCTVMLALALKCKHVISDTFIFILMVRIKLFKMHLIISSSLRSIVFNSTCDKINAIGKEDGRVRIHNYCNKCPFASGALLFLRHQGMNIDYYLLLEPDILFIHEFLIPYREQVRLQASERCGIKNE